MHTDSGMTGISLSGYMPYMTVASLEMSDEPVIYVCPTSAHWGFLYGYRRYKDNTFTLKTTLFDW